MKTNELSIESLKKNGWPGWLESMFPLLWIYYRPNSPKSRRQADGYRGTGKLNKITGKEQCVKVWKHHKKSATRNQNNNSFMAALMISPNDYGTCQRIARHRGFSLSIAAVYATEDEVNRYKESWRMPFFKFKTISELFNWRKLEDPDWKLLCDRLEIQYPSKATGQLILL